MGLYKYSTVHILFLLFSGLFLVDDYVLVAKDKHGYNVEQVWGNLKSLDLNLVYIF